MMNRIIVIAFLCTSLGASSVLAQKNKKNDRRPDSKKRESRQTSSKGAAVRKSALSNKQQQNALTFARENHPELVPLIKQLSKTHSAEHARALRDLHTASNRFTRLRERLSPEKYEQQLAVWKLNSHIRLQLAKWSVSPVSRNEEIEADVKTSLAARNAIQRQQYEDELAKLKERMARLESLMGKLDTNVDAEWERLSRSVTRKGRSKKKLDPKKKIAQDKARTNRAKGARKKKNNNADGDK